MDDVDAVGLVAVDHVLGDGERIGIARRLHLAGIVLGNDRLGIEALDDRAALAADDVEQHRLALGDQLIGLAAGGADDVAAEGAGEAAVGGRHDDQVRLVLARAGEQLRASGPAVTRDASD